MFPADYLLDPLAEFCRIAKAGYDLVDRLPGTLLTFGISPTYPATGFGYLELGDEIHAAHGSPLHGTTARAVKRFREKPDLATAGVFLEAGPARYLWNSGMFIWRAATFLKAVERYQPETFIMVENIAASWNTADRDRVLRELYPAMRRISVDFAVMEPASTDTPRRGGSPAVEDIMARYRVMECLRRILPEG